MRITITLSDETYKLLQENAKKDYRTLSGEIQMVLDKMLPGSPFTPSSSPALTYPAGDARIPAPTPSHSLSEQPESKIKTGDVPVTYTSTTYTPPKINSNSVMVEVRTAGSDEDYVPTPLPLEYIPRKNLLVYRLAPDQYIKWSQIPRIEDTVKDIARAQTPPFNTLPLIMCSYEKDIIDRLKDIHTRMNKNNNYSEITARDILNQIADNDDRPDLLENDSLRALHADIKGWCKHTGYNFDMACRELTAKWDDYNA